MVVFLSVSVSVAVSLSDLSSQWLSPSASDHCCFSQFGDLQDSRNEQLLRIKQLTSQFDQELVGHLLELAVELRPNVQVSENY